MVSIKALGLALIVALMLGVSSAEAQVKKDGPNYGAGVGATEAEARAAAEQDAGDIMDDFIANLDPGDYFLGHVETSSTWDGTTYTIEFDIIWFDR